MNKIVTIGIIIAILIVTSFCVIAITEDIFKSINEFTDDNIEPRLKVTFTTDEVKYYSNIEKYDVVKNTQFGLVIDLKYKNGSIEQISGVVSADYITY